MLILSQDKKKIVNLKEGFALEIVENIIYTFCSGDNYAILGEYKDEERAKEIFEAIWKGLRQGLDFYEMWDE
jgi:hypothetical protein